VRSCRGIIGLHSWLNLLNQGAELPGFLAKQMCNLGYAVFAHPLGDRSDTERSDRSIVCVQHRHSDRVHARQDEAAYERESIATGFLRKLQQFIPTETRILCEPFPVRLDRDLEFGIRQKRKQRQASRANPEWTAVADLRPLAVSGSVRSRRYVEQQEQGGCQTWPSAGRAR